MLTEQQAQQVIDCCCELVQAQSFAGSEAAAAQVALRWMQQLGFDEAYTDDYGSVIGRIQGQAGGGSNLHYDGHLDTVPATARDLWQHDPFGAEVADGAIWGRGAVDMKGPVAAMICAAAFLPREVLHGSITVSASVAEEEYEGAALAAILHLHPADMVVIGEPSGLQVGTAQKGRAGISVRTYGIPAHSAVPHEGQNAVYSMIEAIRLLRELPTHHDERVGSTVLELIELISQPYPGTSIVPDGCRSRWDRRLIPGETAEQVLAELRAALAPLGKLATVQVAQKRLEAYTGMPLEGEDFHPAWRISDQHPLVQAALASVQAVGLPATIWTAPYCTNGSATAGRLALPTIILGPGDPAQLHRIDEHLAVDELLHGTQIYMELSRRMLGG